MVSREDVLDALRDVYDPEVRLNVVDLGLVYEIRISGDKVYVRLGLTTPMCPLANALEEWARQRIYMIPGVRRVEVELDYETPWNPDRMSPEVRQLLGWM